MFPVPPLFVAGHAGLDFLNTCFRLLPEGTPVDVLPDGRAFVEWLLRAGLLDEAAAARAKRRFGDGALDGAAAEARKLRQWASVWIDRWCEEPGAHHGADLQRLNRLLERTNGYREVVEDDAGCRLVERTRVDSAGDLVALVALQIALLVTAEEPALVKRCAGTDCVLRFVDRTKAHRRVFCSAAVCGNRAKVAAFRERQRARPAEK